MEQAECSEMSTYEIQTPGNYPEEIIQHSEHGESLKSKGTQLIVTFYEIAYYESDQGNIIEMRGACICHTVGGEQ